MSPTLTAPGVYTEQVPSTQRAIVGVSTSVAAFIGPCARGPVNRATPVTSFGDFERQFGGLWRGGDLGHVVAQFFRNGGRFAHVVRIHRDADAATGAVAEAMVLTPTPAAAALPGFDHLHAVVTHGAGDNAYTLTLSARDAADTVLTDSEAPANGYTVSIDLSADADPTAAIAAATTGTVPPIGLATLTGGVPTARPPVTAAPHIEGESQGPVRVPSTTGLGFTAANPGAWGNGLTVTVTPDPGGTTFELTATLIDAGGSDRVTESYSNLVLDADAPNGAASTLAARSALIRLTDTGPGLPAAEASITLAGGDDGEVPQIAQYAGSEAARTGIHALNEVENLNLLCVPFPEAVDVVSEADRAGFWGGTAIPWCARRGAMALIDPPPSWTGFAAVSASLADAAGWVSGLRSPYAAQYFPTLIAGDALQENRLRAFPPCGAVAGVIARTDGLRGVWKAPAGLDATLNGIADITVSLNDGEQGLLNNEGVNCVRAWPSAGRVIWGARTLYGDNRRASEWKYLPIRRLASFLQQSLRRGTQWAVFEPNDAPLWSQLRLSIDGFMHQLFRQGAFAGQSPQDAYFVRCDGATTTQADIDAGIVNVEIGFAPVRPAEFVVIRIQQRAAG